MAQMRHDRFSPTRGMERIDTNDNTPIADGPDRPLAPLRKRRLRFGNDTDVLKMRIFSAFHSGNGMAVYKTVEMAKHPLGSQNVRIPAKKPAFRSGGDFIGALFNT